MARRTDRARPHRELRASALRLIEPAELTACSIDGHAQTLVIRSVIDALAKFPTVAVSAVALIRRNRPKRCGSANGTRGFSVILPIRDLSGFVQSGAIEPRLEIRPFSRTRGYPSAGGSLSNRNVLAVQILNPRASWLATQNRFSHARTSCPTGRGRRCCCCSPFWQPAHCCGSDIKPSDIPRIGSLHVSIGQLA